LIQAWIAKFPGNQLLVEVGISAAGMHEKGAERNIFQSASRGVLIVLLLLLSSDHFFPILSENLNLIQKSGEAIPVFAFSLRCLTFAASH
jgi:hypothetical protein